jgi:uncharacterized protein
VPLARTSARPLAAPPRALVVIGRLVLAVIAYEAALGVLAIGLYALGVWLAGSKAWAFSMLGLAIAEGGALLAVLAVWKLVDRRPVAAMGLRTERLRRQWLRGAAVGALMMTTVVLVWFTVVDGATWSINTDPQRAALAVILGFIGFLVQGPAEEVLFRGYLLENLRAKWGTPIAIGVSATAFGVLHAANPAFGVLPFINLILFGVATALYKLRIDAGQLWGVFAIHSVWNWLQQVVFGLPNSGNASGPDETLFSVQPSTSLPDPFWGGGFGPEGTLGTTVVLLALIGAALRVKRTLPP